MEFTFNLKNKTDEEVKELFKKNALTYTNAFNTFLKKIIKPVHYSAGKYAYDAERIKTLEDGINFCLKNVTLKNLEEFNLWFVKAKK